MKIQQRNSEYVHFLSFFTEGNKKDLGSDLTKEAKILSSRVEEYFHSTTMLSPSILIEHDKKWENFFCDKREWVQENYLHTIPNFRWNENWAALNFLQWKPMLIYEQLVNSEKIKFGDIIFYHDVNVTKYPEYLINIEDWPKFLSSKMKGKSILLFNDNNTPLRVDCKKELIDKYQCEKFEHKAHTWAGALAVRKDPNGIKFIHDWVKMVDQLENISPITSYGDRDGYYWHSQEQACLSI